MRLKVKYSTLAATTCRIRAAASQTKANACGVHSRKLENKTKKRQYMQTWMNILLLHSLCLTYSVSVFRILSSDKVCNYYGDIYVGSYLQTLNKS